MAEGAQMDPLPLISFAKLVMEETNAPIDREFVEVRLAYLLIWTTRKTKPSLGHKWRNPPFRSQKAVSWNDAGYR